MECPLLALWGGRGVMEKTYDVEAVWREYATDVKGKPLDAGHFLAEERPEETMRELKEFPRRVDYLVDPPVLWAWAPMRR